MAINLWVDVADAAGNVIGYGPLAHVTKWSQVKRLSRAGEFSFSMPLTERAAAEVQPKRYVYARAIEPGKAPITIGAGIIDKISKSSTAAGNTLTVRGPDLLSELSRASTEALNISGKRGHIALTEKANENLSYSDTPLVANQFARTGGWQLSGNQRLNSFVAMEYRYQSVLGAMVNLGDKTGEHFRVDGAERNLRWLGAPSEFDESGFIATTNAQALATRNQNDSVALIRKVTQTQDSWDLVNRVYFFGAGNADARLSINRFETIRTLPYGYISSYGDSTITNYLSVRQYGVHEAQKVFSDIRPLDETNDALTAATDTLLIAGYNWLRKRIAPIQTYDLECDIPGLIEPGQTIDLDVRQYYDGVNLIDIRQTLYVLEATTNTDHTGIRTSRLTVSTSDELAQTDQQYILDRISDIGQYSVYPQLASSLNTTTYVIELAGTEPGGGVYYIRDAIDVENVTLRFIPLSPAGLDFDDFLVTANGIVQTESVRLENGWFEIDITEETQHPAFNTGIQGVNNFGFRVLNQDNAIITAQVEQKVIR